MVYMWTLTVHGQTQLNQSEALDALHYLNRIRNNPKAYIDSTRCSDLGNVDAMPALKINPILQKVAEEKAIDMAQRNYFDHIDKSGEGINIKLHRSGYSLEAQEYARKSNNYYESLSAGAESGKEHINELILDRNVRPPSHRHHLLGMNAFWGACDEIGIAIAENPDSHYATYMVIIIARSKK